jgi:peptide deformylase
MKRNVISVLTDEGLALLRTKSEKVPFTVLGDGTLCLDGATNELIADLKTFVADSGGWGMSAIQLGVAKRIFAMCRKSGNIIIVINPKIVERSDENVASPEGCFSIPCMPGVGAVVSRAKSISVQYEDETGRCIDTQLNGMEARIFQHEMDHLEGILCIDKDRLTGWGKF